MASDTKTISLIVPALNEEAVIEMVLTGIYEAARVHFRDFELIAVDDGSTDATGEIMERLAARHPQIRVVHNKPNIGLGASFQRGLKQARFQYVMLLCGDGGLPARSLPAIFKEIGTADLVIPWMTNLKKIKSERRYFVSRTYTNLLNFLFGLKLHYYNGLPVYRRSLVNAIEVRSSGFGFQAEIVVKLLKSGCTYVEVAVEGAEEKGRSFAFRPRNILSVGRTLARLVLAVGTFKRVPREVIEKSRKDGGDYVEKPQQ